MKIIRNIRRKLSKWEPIPRDKVPNWVENSSHKKILRGKTFVYKCVNSKDIEGKAVTYFYRKKIID